MKNHGKRWPLVAMLAVSFLPFPRAGFADTLVLRNGVELTGFYEGGTSRVIHFRTDSGLGEYDLLTVEAIRFGDDAAPPPRTADASTAPGEDATPRLQTRQEAQRPPEADNAANTAWTIPGGSALTVRMIDALDSEVDAVGRIFNATLAQALEVDGIEVAPGGAAIRGRIVQAASGGRVRGSAELRLELTRINVNGVPYAIETAEYAEVGEGRGEESARRIGTAAGIGAIIGAIAGGGQGAAIGAGVGAGAAGTVQVLTSGEQIYIPAETLLRFTLREPLIIAAR